MSTLLERDEKRCLNCNSLVYGRYCQVCGQENVHHKMTFFGMFKHFVFDLLHFDGKFFSTIINLFKKPGFVAKEHINGKRVKYLEPFKMYIFTSTILFIVMPYLGKLDVNNSNKQDTQLIKITFGDTASAKKGDTMPTPMFYATYDDFEKVILKNSKKIGWLQSTVYKKLYAFGKEHKVSNEELPYEYGKYFLKKLPTLLFFILPIFAWIVQLLYLRKRDLKFSDHGVFTLYFFVTIFISIMASKLIAILSDNIFNSELSEDIILVLILFLLAHLLFALKRFYEQGWLLTIFKFILFSLFGVVVILLSFTLISLIGILLF